MVDELIMKREPIPVGERLIEIIRAAWAAKKPLILCGVHGCGKSEIVEQAATEMEINFKVMDLSIMEPPDLLGMPVIEGKVTKYCPPEQLPRESEEWYKAKSVKTKKELASEGILCFEELNRCDPSIQAPCLQLLTARALNSYEMPDGWMIAACINPSDGEYNVNDLDPALQSRFMMIDVVPSKSEWLKYAESHDIHSAVKKIVSEHPDPFGMAKTKGQKKKNSLDKYVSPRTWKYVSDLINTFVDYADSLDMEILKDCIAAYLNEEWTMAVINSLIELGEYEAEELSVDVDDDEIIDPQNLKGEDKLPSIKNLVAKYVSGYQRKVRNMKDKLVCANVELMANGFNNLDSLNRQAVASFCSHLGKERHLENLNKFFNDIPDAAKTIFVKSLKEDLKQQVFECEETTGLITALNMNEDGLEKLKVMYGVNR